MKCNKCGYDDSGSGDMAHVCQRPSFRYGEHPTSFGLFNPKQEPVEIPDCGEAGHADGACGNRECLPSFWRNTTPPQRTWVGLTIEDEYVRNYLWERGLVAVDENPNLRDEKSVWVGLTQDEQIELCNRAEKRQAYQGVPTFVALFQEVEAKLKEKNNG